MTDTPKTTVYATNGTLVSGEVHTVTLTGTLKHVTIINTHASVALTFCVGVWGGHAATPVVGADDCYTLPAGAALEIDDNVGEIKLIATGTPTYIIQGR